ncbi:MAG: transglutaminase domain-containing protein [Candidatus Binatia bacterium]|nr:transglutaminase domain-containing protein [Candidatus Binatia bacterium]
MRGRLLAGVAVLGLASMASVSAGDPWKDSAQYAIEYRVDLTALAATENDKVRVWVPLPVETTDQTILSTDIDSPWASRMVRDSNGNRVVYLEGEGAASKPLVLRTVVQRRPSHGTSKDLVSKDGPDDPSRFGKPARMIPLEGLIEQVAKQEARGLTGEDEKVRAYYDYVVANMAYDKRGTGWGQGNATWACTNKRGNCTDFHSLFIGMARSQGIPARFLIGLPVPGKDGGVIPGYHCWAEFWDESAGWVPVDSSEANKRDMADEYYGHLPNDRVEFTTGRDLVLEPPQAGEPLNYFIYPYVEIAGEPAGDVPATFAFERQPPERPTSGS